MIKIPTYPEVSSDYEMDIVLEGQSVTLRFTWNVRNEFWYLTISIAGAPHGAFKLTPNWPALTSYRASVPFEGDFIVVKDDLSAPDTISYDALGTTWGIYYLSPQEVLDWEETNGLR